MPIANSYPKTLPSAATHQQRLKDVEEKKKDLWNPKFNPKGNPLTSTEESKADDKEHRGQRSDRH